MKNILIIIVLIPFISISQIIVPSGCGSTNWPSGINLNDTKTFTAPIMGPGYFYNWIATDGQLEIISQIGNQANIKRVGNSPNSFVFVLIYKENTIVCSDYLKVNNIDSGGGGTIGQKSINIIENKNSYSIYPNPLKKGEHLSIINLDLNKILNIKVFNPQGKEIKNAKRINDKLIINSDSRGLHFVKIYTDEGIITEKLIIN